MTKEMSSLEPSLWGIEKRVQVVSLIVSVAFCLVACQRFRPSPTGASQPPPPPLNISGSYCTAWAQTNWASDGTAPINLSCLDEKGVWSVMGGFPEPVPSGGPSVGYGEPSLTVTASHDLLLGYSKWEGSQGKQHRVARFQQGSGWSSIASSVNSDDTGSEIPSYSQFGGKVFEFLGKPFYYWTKSSEAYLSTPSGSKWSHSKIPTPPDQLVRHPESLVSADGWNSYLYYGQPQPTVFRFNGSSFQSLGGPTVDSTKEYNLYTSLVEWKGGLVLAYTSSDYPINGSWFVETDKTKVSYYNGTQWSELSAGIQDTPGHDGVNPFLFTIGDELYVMYADYTTSGLPTDPGRISFRFRVKRWSGTTWERVGDESELVNLSQRFEFLNDQGTVLVTVVRNVDAQNSERSVLVWKNGRFGFAGGPIKSYPNSGYRMSFRPGAIVRYAAD